jgi:hypothetical protein
MKRHHLPVGFKLAGHYEIVELLGEDEFEILYLVKDLHLAEKLFVLKELFLPSYASRNEDNSLAIMAKSKQIFEQTKKDIIAEIEVLKTNEEQPSPKVYGYFEENNTLYTIMEFVNDSDISSYLKANTQNKEADTPDKIEEQVAEEEITLPAIESSTIEEQKPKSTLFLKILIVCVLIFLALAFYGYQILQEEKQRIKEKSERNSVTVITGSVIPHPPLESREKKQEEERKDDTSVKNATNEQNESASSKNLSNEPALNETASNEAEYREPTKEEGEEGEILEGVPKEEIYQTEDELDEIVANEEAPNIFDEEDTFDEGIYEENVLQEGVFEEEGFDVIETPSTTKERTNSLLGRRIN